MGKRLDHVVTYCVLILFALVNLIPVVIVVLLAFQPAEDMRGMFSLPRSFTLDNFTDVWQTGVGFGRYLINSSIVTGAVVSVTSVCSILAGYAFGAMRFRGRTALFYLLLIGLIIPFEVTVVPLYYDLRDVGLTDTYWALILPQVGLLVAFGAFWMRAFFLSTPQSIVEAARLDGASSLTILAKVLLPSAKPAVLTMVLLLFIFSWNDFLLALVMINEPNLQTAPLGLTFLIGQRTTDVNALAAGAVMVAIPIVAMFIIFQRQFARGMFTQLTRG